MAGVVFAVGGAALGHWLIGGAITSTISVGSIIGSATGALVGGYVDNAIIFPPKGPKKPAKMDDIPIQTASEGSPINRCLGPETRVGGTIIWMSELRAKPIRQKFGGSGGGKKATVGWNYFADFAVAICEGEINAIKKIWADSNIIYSDDADKSAAGSVLSADARDLHFYNNFAGAYSSPALRRTTMYIESPNGGPDLSVFRSGRNVVSAGWANGGNNSGAPGFRCLEAGDVPGGGGETYVILLNSMAVDEAAGASVTLTQAAEEYDASVVDEVEIYIGDQTQTADDLIEADQGAGNVPGFRGIAYVVLENVALADFGNRPPQFNFLVEEAASRTIEDAIGAIIEESRLTASDYDSSALSGIDLTGQITPGPEAPVRRLEPLMVGYDLVVQNIDSVLTFIERQNVQAVAVAEDDLAAHEEGGDAPRPLTIVDPDDAALPTEINITFSEPNLDYLRGSQRERKLAGSSPQDNVISMSMPLTLGASAARAIAKRVLWAAWLNRQRVSIQLPPSYINVLENDRLTITYNPTITVLVQRVERGHNHVIMVEGIIEDSNVLDQDATADNPDTFATELYVPPALFPSIIDIAPLDEDHVELAGFYFSICCEDRRVSFPGGQMFHKKDDGGSYNIMQAIDIDAAMGHTTEVLPDGVTGIWDTVNVVKVRMWEGAPVTADELDVLDGANIAVVGNEILAYRDVTQIDSENYELSYLLRGLRNTELEAGVHEERERVILLNEGGIQFESHSTAFVGKKRKYKAVPLGSDPSEQGYINLQLGGYTLRCFSPCHVKGDWDLSIYEDEDFIIYWIRRTRGLVRHFGQAPENTPLYESPERYKVEILDAPGGNVVRTFIVIEDDGEEWDTPEGTYTAMQRYTEAQQIADFGSVQSDYDVRVSQWSYKIGWGKPKEENIPA